MVSWISQPYTWELAGKLDDGASRFADVGFRSLVFHDSEGMNLTKVSEICVELQRLGWYGTSLLCQQNAKDSWTIGPLFTNTWAAGYPDSDEKELIRFYVFGADQTLRSLKEFYATEKVYDRCTLLTKTFGCVECHRQTACLRTAWESATGPSTPLDSGEYALHRDVEERAVALQAGVKLKNLETVIAGYLLVSPSTVKTRRRFGSPDSADDLNFEVEHIEEKLQKASRAAKDGQDTAAFRRTTCAPCSFNKLCDDWARMADRCASNGVSLPPQKDIAEAYAPVLLRAVELYPVPWQIKVLLMMGGRTVKLRNRSEHKYFAPTLDLSDYRFKVPLSREPTDVILVKQNGGDISTLGYQTLAELDELPLTEEAAAGFVRDFEMVRREVMGLFVIAGRIRYIHSRSAFGSSSRAVYGFRFDRHTLAMFSGANRTNVERAIGSLGDLAGAVRGGMRDLLPPVPGVKLPVLTP